MFLNDHPDGNGFLKKRWNLNNPFRSDGDELRRIRYDLINSRFLAEGIDATRWPAYIRDLRGRLTEGGWLQMLEFNLNIQSDSGRREEAHSLVTWMDHYSQAMQRLQRDPLVGNKLQQYMAAAGLVDVRYERQRLPIGPWLGMSQRRRLGFLSTQACTLHDH